jgi:hypothetical protein
MFKKLLAGLFAVMMIGCAGIGVKEALVQKNGCPYPEMYKMDAEVITVADEDYYMWNGMQMLIPGDEGFTFILVDYDANGVVFGFDEDGDCEVDRCVGIQVTDFEDVKNAIEVDDITVTWAGQVDCNMVLNYIEENK